MAHDWVQAFQNKMFNWALLGSVLMAAVVVPGLNPLFHVSHLDGYQWAIVLVAGMSIIVIVELVKLIQRSIFKRINNIGKIQPQTSTSLRTNIARSINNNSRHC